MDTKYYRDGNLYTRRWTTTVDTGYILDVASFVKRQKYISNLNYGKFKPGIFRCNAVTICDISREDFGTSCGLKSGNLNFEVTGPVGVKIPFINLNYINGYQVSGTAQGKSLALVQAYSKLNSPDLFDGGVFLAELSETIAMLRSPMRGVTNLLRKKQFRDPRKLMKAGADAWMEFRYGMTPFVSDIRAARDAFSKVERRINRVLETERSRVTAENRLSGSSSTMHAASTSQFHVYYHVFGSATVSYNSGVSYAKLVNVPSLASRLGLTVRDLPSILWEKVPLSFVADWFYNTGDWLRAIQPNPNIQCLGGYTSVKTTIDLNYVAERTQFLSSVGKSDANGSVSLTRLERTCNSSLPALPVRKISTLSLAREVDSVILVQQRIPKPWKQAIAYVLGKRR